MGGGRWAGDLNWSLVISVLGLVLAYRAKRLVVAVSFIMAFLVFSVVRAELRDLHILLTTTILFSPGLLVLTYFMITDPRTSPNSTNAQVFFGIAVACIDQVLRFNEIRMSAFIALFLVTMIYSAFDFFILDKEKFDSWDYLNLKRALNERV